MIFHTLSRSNDETRRAGAAIAERISAGDLICLHGSLGAGKTTLVQGLAEALSINEPVTSPTFTIINEYSGSVPLYHVDLYRIGDREEFEMLGLDDYFNGSGITCIEWSEKVEELLPHPLFVVAISIEADGSRRITMEEQP